MFCLPNTGYVIIVSFTLGVKLVSSKHLFQVRLEILSRSVENMASHLLTKYNPWSKSCQSLRSLESWNRCTCTSCTWLPFLNGQVCSQVWCSPYLAANFGFFELRTFPRWPCKVEVGTFYPFTVKVGSKYTCNILEGLDWCEANKYSNRELFLSNFVLFKRVKFPWDLYWENETY